jgi:protease YdgD
MKPSGARRHPLIWIAVASIALALWPTALVRANIFGTDDRRLLTDADNLSAVGLIACAGTTRRPTAALVAPQGSRRRDVIVTVAHAFLGNDDRPLAPCEFWPGGMPADATRVAYTLLGTAAPDTAWNADWAVAVLARDLPAKYRPLEPLIMFPEEADELRARGVKFLLAGHNGESGPLMVSENCGPMRKRNADINRFDARAFNHDCDMMPGWSGGPLMVELNGRPFVVAVNATELNALVTRAGEAYNGVYNANTAVRIDGAFFDAIARLSRNGIPQRPLVGKAACRVWMPEPVAPRAC